MNITNIVPNHNVLSNLIEWKVSLSMAGGMEIDDL